MERIYALNLTDDRKILSATYDEYAPIEYPRVKELPEGNINEYLFVDNEFIYDPLPKVESEVIPTQLDMIEAQVTYTAMMTDTLLEV